MQVSSSTAIIASGPHSRARCHKRIEIPTACRAPRRASGRRDPPVCTALKCSSGSAADVEDLAQRYAHRHFDQARVLHLTGDAKTTVPGDSACQMLSTDPAPRHDLRRHGIAFDVVDDGGPLPQARDRREGRLGTRLAATNPPPRRSTPSPRRRRTRPRLPSGADRTRSRCPGCSRRAGHTRAPG